MEKKQNWLRSCPISVAFLQLNQTKNDFTKWIAILIVILLPFNVANALPSYARQTSMSCTACHTSFPELNSFGRQFKVNGYTLNTASTIVDQGDSLKPRTRLNLLNNLPLSVMVESSFTNIAKDVVGQQNNSGQFPQQLSLFFAGQITPHIGSFIQMTYASASTAPSPAKSTLIESLGGQVIGVGAYGLFNNLIFAEFSTYRSAQVGFHNPPDTTNTNVIKDFIPYWRLALQHEWGKNYLELGTYGIASTQYLTGISGALDKFVDVGVDLQYERILPFGNFSFHTSYTSETETRDLSAEVNYNFQSFKMDGNMFFKNGMGGTIGYFNNTGSPDIANFPNGDNRPNSSGFIFQIEYLPWYNTKFAAQYVSYQKFDGSSTNYNGLGRNAVDNNTIYLMAWLCF